MLKSINYGNRVVLISNGKIVAECPIFAPQSTDGRKSSAPQQSSDYFNKVSSTKILVNGQWV